jgi:ribosomal protein L24E
MGATKFKCGHCGCVIEDTDKAVVWKKGEETFRFCSGACEKAYQEIKMKREEALRRSRSI